MSKHTTEEVTTPIDEVTALVEKKNAINKSTTSAKQKGRKVIHYCNPLSY